MDSRGPFGLISDAQSGRPAAPMNRTAQPPRFFELVNAIGKTLANASHWSGRWPDQAAPSSGPDPQYLRRQ